MGQPGISLLDAGLADGLSMRCEPLYLIVKGLNSERILCAKRTQASAERIARLLDRRARHRPGAIDYKDKLARRRLSGIGQTWWQRSDKQGGRALVSGHPGAGLDMLARNRVAQHEVLVGNGVTRQPETEAALVQTLQLEGMRRADRVANRAAGINRQAEIDRSDRGPGRCDWRINQARRCR